jgi:hypothetical protein
MAGFITSEKTPRKSSKDARFRAPSPHHHDMRVRTGRFNEDEQVRPISS